MFNDKPGSGAEGGGRGVRGGAGVEGRSRNQVCYTDPLCPGCAVFLSLEVPTGSKFMTLRNLNTRLNSHSFQFLLKMSIIKTWLTGGRKKIISIFVFLKKYTEIT